VNDFADWQKEATPHVAKASVCFDRALVAEYEEAVRDLDRATKGTSEMLDGPRTELANRVADLEKAVQSKTRELVFRSIGRRAWKRLLADHPPTKQPEDMKAGYNLETFVPAAMAASCVSPGLTLEQADWIMAELPDAVMGEIVDACFTANLEGGDVKKAAATAVVALSRNRSTPR
jgi:hypothetical protein